MSNSATKHPLDFEALAKGTWIEVRELELALSCKRDDISFGQRLLGLRSMIEARTGILSRAEGQRLRLMTDSEALVWVVKQAGVAAHRIELAAVRMRNNVDAAQLSAPEQAVHEHAARVLTEMSISQREHVRKNAKLFALMGRAIDDGNDA